MAIQLVAGQTIAVDYTLLNPNTGLHQNKTGEASWLAIQDSTQQRVQLDLLEPGIDVSQTQNRLNHFQALIHPNILLSHSVITHEDSNFLVSAYRRGLASLDLSQPFAQLWVQLQIIVETLEYAHSLGFIHGSITPSCCLIADDGSIYLSGFGVPSHDFQSPDSTASVQTDIYAIAQLIYTCLTGEPHKQGDVVGAAVIDSDLSTLLTSMLADSPNQRPANFSSLLELVNKSEQETLVEPTSFARPKSEPVQQQDTDEHQAHRPPREQQLVAAPVVIAALALLILIGGALFYLLPERDISPQAPTLTSEPLTSEQPTTTLETTPSEPTLAPLELAKLEELKTQGVELAAELLRRQVEVEDIGGRLWAGERYDQSSELGISGDEAYRDEKFQTAVDQYQAGIKLLEDILAETDSVFAENLAKGEQALLDGAHAVAIEAFQILTRIEPENQELIASLNRALSLEQVVRLTQDAQTLEKNGDLSAAIDNFKKAVDLDSLWQPAAEGIRRINNQIARNRFQDEMSQGFAQIESEQFELAREAFERAQQILPNSTEPDDGLQQIALAEVQAEIRDLNRQIAELEAQGDWNSAIPLYENILSISPGLAPATAGLAKATEQSELQATLKQYIDQPQLLQTDDGLESARSALVAAATAGPHFRSEARDLSHLVSLARIEVQVLLTSDQRTEVTVYQVGSYGQIDRAELSLIPGVYTFVGKRSGYRDVYKEVHIKGDVNPVTVDVRCSERI